jgi:hypothetical protein
MITRREDRERAKEALGGWAVAAPSLATCGPSGGGGGSHLDFYPRSPDIVSEVTRHDLIRPVSHYFLILRRT